MGKYEFSREGNWEKCIQARIIGEKRSIRAMGWESKDGECKIAGICCEDTESDKVVEVKLFGYGNYQAMGIVKAVMREMVRQEEHTYWHRLKNKKNKAERRGGSAATYPPSEASAEGGSMRGARRATERLEDIRQATGGGREKGAAGETSAVRCEGERQENGLKSVPLKLETGNRQLATGNWQPGTDKGEE